MSNEQHTPNIAVLPLAEAIDWTSNWRHLIKELHKDPMGEFQMIKAFNLTLGEVELAIHPNGEGETPHSVRFYIGSTTNDPKSLDSFKLIVVGVNKHGKDILTRIGDFSNPCPNLCDPKSPLVTGKIQELKC